MIDDKIIVVPDVHGRIFWKKVMDDQYKDFEIVFLGDYLDQYPHETSITPGSAIENFKEVIKFARANPGRVRLLLGNHDAHYLSLSSDACRMDYKNAKKIFTLFNDNIDLFNMAYKWHKTLFTHAGVTIKWLSQNPELEDITADNVEERLNSMFKKLNVCSPLFGLDGLQSFVYSPFGDIGRSRGGYAPHGSCIWADAIEMVYHSAFFEVKNPDEEDSKTIELNIELYQITGHTQLTETGGIVHPHNNWWMCDSRTCFIWDENNKKLEIL